MMEQHQLPVYADGRIVPREEAAVSVFDAAFQSGDAVWEGLRFYNGSVFRLSEHLARLEDSAKALRMTLPLPIDGIERAIYETVADHIDTPGIHIRLMVSRGKRRTSGMDPRNAPPHGALYILPEVKPIEQEPGTQTLRTSYTRRPRPDVLDPTIHHSNQLNSIIARLQVQDAGDADAALMLDTQGFVAEADTANIFLVKDDRVLTPMATACLHGITRDLVISIASELGHHVEERQLSLFDVYSADEVFLTGTVCELAPVANVDDRVIGGGTAGPVWRKLLAAYRDLANSETSAEQRTVQSKD